MSDAIVRHNVKGYTVRATFLKWRARLLRWRRPAANEEFPMDEDFMPRLRVLFICTGNICRSPTAEGVARALASHLGVSHRFEFDSAGTHGFHAGDVPDPRAVAAAAKRGYDLAALRARRLSEFDFVRFDRLLAMDRGHLSLMQRACPLEHRHKLGMMMEFSDLPDVDEIPDPYYGGADGFEIVLDQVENAAAGLIRAYLQNDNELPT